MSEKHLDEESQSGLATEPGISRERRAQNARAWQRMQYMSEAGEAGEAGAHEEPRDDEG